MTIKRNAYLLTTNEQSERTQTRKKLLQEIGFNVLLVQHTPDKDPVISNRLSMMNCSLASNGTPYQMKPLTF